jgi:acetyltransferase-like isoleucine patch superfamily enzyme
LLSSNINILSTTHCIEGRSWIRDLDNEYIRHNGKLKDVPIIIGDECWIGLNVVIMPGTNLGRGCVVGANSVVKGSFPDYSVIGGVPAKILKYR